MDLSLHIASWEYKKPFRITGNEWTHETGLVAQLEQDGFVGRGEGNAVYFMGETPDSMFEQANSIAADIINGIFRDELQNLMPAGGARDALDCALWDLECKRSGKTIWQLTGIDPKPVKTVFTIGLEDSPEAMAAARASNAPILKIKLDNHMPYEKLAAIRAARSDAILVVDANQGWTFELMKELLPKCVDLGLTHWMNDPQTTSIRS